MCMNSAWSDDFRAVLSRSREEANRLGLQEVSSSCLLLGMMKIECRAAAILKHLGMDCAAKYDEYAAEVRAERNGSSPHEAKAGTEATASLQMDNTCQRLLRIASLEARKMKDEMTRSEHLLLSILRTDGNSACTFLNHEGITYRKVAESLNIRPSIKGGFGFADDEQGPMPSNFEKPKSGAASQDRPDNEEGSDTPVLDTFGTDLTQRALEGGLDPVVGRESETLRIAQILSRRKKNNPLLIGEPGVGKSAVVEGLAQLIVNRKAPHALLGKRIVALDMAAIVAGTQFRGQFEERLRRLIEEMKSHKEIILFIDEIHTIIGAGSAAGTLDAANILKPSLTRGDVQCIGATTIAEYRKTIEKDGALERRFQKVMLEATSPEETLQILKNLRGRYEEFHSVHYTDEALEACVKLTNRYVTDRSLPDKAIDALDEAGSRVRLARVSVPKAVVDKENEIEALKKQKAEAAKKQDYELAARLRDAIGQLSADLEQLNQEWTASLKDDRGVVDVKDIADVVSMMSGVPAGKMAQNEMDRLRRMEDVLREKIIAQDDAIKKISRAIIRNRLGLKGYDRPIGTFMFVGPTGVGKTYLVKCLAEWMFDRPDALIRIDMSEYGEKYSTSRLVGAPPGYVGYDEGGQLTEKVRRHPYSVILLDEIEKAHPDVFNTLLQVMDEGRMTDGNGTTVDFRNTIIIMTSNSGSRQVGDFANGIGFGVQNNVPAEDKVESIIQKTLRRQFAPEFLNRLDDIIVFHSLDEASALKIAELEVQALKKRVAGAGLDLEVTPEVLSMMVEKGYDARYGARSLKRTIQKYLEDPLCDAMIGENPPHGKVLISLGENKQILINQQ